MGSLSSSIFLFHIHLQKFHMNMFQNHMCTRVVTCDFGKCSRILTSWFLLITDFCAVITDFCTVIDFYIPTAWDQPITVKKYFPVYYYYILLYKLEWFTDFSATNKIIKSIINDNYHETNYSIYCYSFVGQYDYFYLYKKQNNT